MGWRNILLTVLIAALFGFAGAELGLRRNADPPDPNRATLNDAVGNLIEHDLNLSPGQKNAIEAINSRYTRQHNQLMANFYMARAQLGGAFSENMSLSGPTRDAIANMQTIVGDLQTLTISHIVDVRQQLTPAQRHVYDQKVVEILMRDAP